MKTPNQWDRCTRCGEAEPTVMMGLCDFCSLQVNRSLPYRTVGGTARDERELCDRCGGLLEHGVCVRWMFFCCVGAPTT